MERKLFVYGTTGRVLLIVSLIILPLFFYFQHVNALLFHITIEFTITIAGVIAALIGILTSHKSDNNLLTRMSPGILFYSLAIFIHTLAYPDMNVFEDQSYNLAITIKTIANIILAFGIFTAVIDKKGKIKTNPRFLVFFLFALTTLSMAFFDIYPDMVVNNQLTVVKILIESFMLILLGSSAVILLSNKGFLFDPDNIGIIVSIGLIILSEIFFFRFLTSDTLLTYFALALRFLGLLTIMFVMIKSNLLKPFNELYFSILEEKNKELTLKQELSNNYYRLTRSQQIGHIGTWELDLKTKTVWGSDEAFQIYGLDMTDDHTLSLEAIQKIPSPKDRVILDDALKSLIEDNEEYNLTFAITNYRGEFHYVNSKASMEFDEEGHPIKIHGVIHDITKLKMEQEKLLYASTHDALTKIYNRRYFMDQRELINDKKYLPYSTAILDINGLKIINDSFGHHSGNEILKRLALVLKYNLKEEAHFAARIGGDEFALMMPNTTKDEAEEKLKTILEELDSEEVYNIKISIAFGIATRTSMDQTFDDILKQAEDEMYLYKIADSASVRNKIIDALLKTLYEKDIYSEEHSQRVSDYAFMLAKACNLTQKKINDIKVAGLVHDIGKITISNEILNKTGKLSEEEFNVIKLHSEKGYRIIHSIGDMDIIANYVLQHHEFYNGKGYPKGISGSDISLEARIISIADAYDAMTSFRDYKPKLSVEDAKKELLRCKGTQFDPELVDLFIEKVL
ncbi:MAG: diguanylate cyclase [Bacilli bacterium]|nr:diguanylate cyclase [Bacilli bacterium]MBN2877505.1 diguanylate cyclase [Bacilli bacterium]